MLSILSSCIGTEIDLSIVTKDLGLLQTRLQDYRYKEPWDTIQLIAGVSGDTIRFLIEQDKQDPENKKMIIEVYPELGRLLSHYPIQTPLAAIDPPVPLAPESIPPNGNFETFFDQKMSEIRSDNKVYVVERFFESKIPHYCIDECACIAKEIAIAMKSE
ncbi:MAG: hypothetical protein KDD25_04460, partial [Bdellovibrionales bacterium]|nr:hypothetical protein [Bdellovibrionales bacterium]